ncbi:hypothetical protein HDU76_013572, partial [Blyttiomyces sp. JEL0837]
GKESKGKGKVYEKGVSIKDINGKQPVIGGLESKSKGKATALLVDERDRDDDDDDVSLCTDYFNSKNFWSDINASVGINKAKAAPPSSSSSTSASLTDPHNPFDSRPTIIHLENKAKYLASLIDGGKGSGDSSAGLNGMESAVGGHKNAAEEDGDGEGEEVSDEGEDAAVGGEEELDEGNENEEGNDEGFE